MIENGKNRHTVWLTDEAWNMVGGEYKADGCSTQNEYIEKAIRFYTGYRKADRNERYLTGAISDVLEKRLGALGDRIGKLLFAVQNGGGGVHDDAPAGDGRESHIL